MLPSLVDSMTRLRGRTVCTTMYCPLEHDSCGLLTAVTNGPNPGVGVKVPRYRMANPTDPLRGIVSLGRRHEYCSVSTCRGTSHCSCTWSTEHCIITDLFLSRFTVVGLEHCRDRCSAVGLRVCNWDHCNQILLCRNVQCKSKRKAYRCKADVATSFALTNAV